MNTLLKRCALKTSLLLVMIFSAACATMNSGSNTYTIKSISSIEAGLNPILIGTHCTYDVTQIKVEVVAAKEVSVADARVSAYLYDADKKLLKAYDRPPASPCAFPPGVKPSTLPIVFDAGKPRVIYFPTAGPIELPWKSIVVVFGDDDKVIAQVYPAGDPRDFDFPERALLK